MFLQIVFDSLGEKYVYISDFEVFEVVDELCINYEAVVQREIFSIICEVDCVCFLLILLVYYMNLPHVAHHPEPYSYKGRWFINNVITWHYWHILNQARFSG